jgi:hypothetical protein
MQVEDADVKGEVAEDAKPNRRGQHGECGQDREGEEAQADACAGPVETGASCPLAQQQRREEGARVKVRPQRNQRKQKPRAPACPFQWRARKPSTDMLPSSEKMCGRSTSRSRMHRKASASANADATALAPWRRQVR